MALTGCNRRRAASLLLGAGLLPALAGSRRTTALAAVPQLAALPGSPAETIRALVKLQGALDGTPRWTFSTGQVHLVLDSERMALPVVDYAAARIAAFRQDQAGDWQIRFRGMILYRQPGMGAFVDDIAHPLDGRPITVRHWRSAIGRYTYTPTGPKADRAFEGESGRDRAAPYLLPWIAVGDDVWVTLDERVRYRRPSDGAWRTDNAQMRYRGWVSELTDPARDAANCETSWHTTLNPFEWLNLGSMPALMMQGGAGRKYDRPDDLPADFVTFAEAKFPGALTDPIDWTE